MPPFRELGQVSKLDTLVEPVLGSFRGVRHRG